MGTFSDGISLIYLAIYILYCRLTHGGGGGMNGAEGLTMAYRPYNMGCRTGSSGYIGWRARTTNYAIADFISQ
jgi:hypothetical protein